MIVFDNRTAVEKISHTLLVVGTDGFLSNGEKWYVAWACSSQADVIAIAKWLRHRSEIKRVRTVLAHRWKQRPNTHTNIYAVRNDHPALSQ